MQRDDKRRDYTPGQGGQRDQDVERQGEHSGGRKDQSGQGSHSGQKQQGGRKDNRSDRNVE